MPRYEYECEQCNHTFEEQRSISERDKPARCPSCGSSDARRIVSLFSSRTTGGSSGCRSAFT